MTIHKMHQDGIRHKALKEACKIPNDNCPKCGKNTVNFDTFEMEDGYCGKFEAICNSCGFEGRQWHTVKFDCWQELKDDGQYEDI